MNKAFAIGILFLTALLWGQWGPAQTILEEDEGLGHYDYLCLTDSTWIHWSTDWAGWTTADVTVHLPGYSKDFPSEWKHDNGSRKHLSTKNQIQAKHFSSASYQPGHPISFDLKLNGSTLNTYTNEMMLFDLVKEDISGSLQNSDKQLVLQFFIDIGSMSGSRTLTSLHVKNIGSLQEGDGDRDIGYNDIRLYYETGSAFSFDGNESFVHLWGDWEGDVKYNNEWKNLELNITIPAGEQLYCYVVIENFSPSPTTGNTAHFELVTDGLQMDFYGSMHKNLARIDAKLNAFPLCLGPSPSLAESPAAPSCQNTSVTYTTQEGMDDYTWTLSGVENTDYAITAGSFGGHTLTVTWLTAGEKTVTINYSENGCPGKNPASVTHTVLAAPVTSEIYHD